MPHLDTNVVQKLFRIRDRAGDFLAQLGALAAGVRYHTMFWRFLPVAIVFYSAALVHAGLGVWALYRRRQFHWKAIEPLQLVLGLSIPALIIAHITGVRIGQAVFGHERLYPQVFYADWIAAPHKMWLMYAVLLVSWIHGSIGLYFWLRMKAFYRNAAPLLLAGAVLIPTLAMLGLYQGGRSIARGMSLQGYKGALASAGLTLDDVRLVEVGGEGLNGAPNARPESQGRLWDGLAPLIAEEVDENLYLASRNLVNVLVVEPRYADPLSLVHYKKVLVTKGAMDKLKEMFA